jgi:hypothetical protein
MLPRPDPDIMMLHMLGTKPLLAVDLRLDPKTLDFDKRPC